MPRIPAVGRHDLPDSRANSSQILRRNLILDLGIALGKFYKLQWPAVADARAVALDTATAAHNVTPGHS